MNGLLERLEQWVREDPLHVCVIDPDGQRWSAGALLSAATSLRARVLAQSPASRGSGAPPIVAIAIRPGGAFWAATLAATQAGCDALLLPETPHQQLHERVLAELAPVLWIGTAEAEQVRTHASASAPAPTAVSPRDGAVQPAFGGIILVSSGTTGRSRFVRRSANAVDDIAAGLCQEGLYVRGDRVASFLPMHHAYGFEHAFIGPLWAGATVHQHGSLNPEALSNAIRAGATVLPLVPATLALLAERDDVPPASRLRALVTAGSPLTVAQRDRARQVFGLQPVDLYGATELGTIWLDRGAGGVPVDGVKVRIANPAAPVTTPDIAHGSPGEVLVQSATRFDQILGVQSGADDLVDGWYRTGDLGVQLPGGGFRIVGRLKHVFDVGGLKVNPYEVEAALEAHPGIATALVHPVEAAPGTFRVGVKLEVKPGCQPVNVAEVRSFLAGKVPAHAVPRMVDCVARLERTPSGKLLRALPQPTISPVRARGAGLADSGIRKAWTRRLFDASATGYDLSSGAAFLGTGRWYRRRMLRSAGLAPGMSLLDVGSGTGLCAWIAQDIVGQAGRVVSLDPSGGMLECARRRGVRETVEGHAESLPFPAHTFDMVSMSYMLRHIDDLVTAFREAHRVLRPRGRIVIFEVTRPHGKLGGVLFRGAMRHVLPAVGVVASGKVSTFPMMRYWADTIEVAVEPECVVQALEHVGFRGVRHLRELGVFSSYRGSAI